MRRIAGVTAAGLGLSVLGGALLGSGLYTFDHAEGTSYMSNDSAACVNCHIMREQYDGWQKTSHHAVATCNDCHTPHDFIGKYTTKMVHGYRHSKGFTLQDFHEPIQITPADRAIVEANCVRCHEGLVAEITASHAGANQPAGCTHCHSDVGHGARR